ncbi:MAG TPA: GntR family transcriptional regulator [Anaerolineae bacterium]|nr:GntR family transcriptional regulator [Anaerolineae bacterium]
MDQINRHSKLPLYHQLYEILRGSITRREWRPGDMIPPESELIETHGVSRTTVRQVLDMLVNEGLIYRQRGRGSYVAHPTLEHGLTRIVSFTEDMRRRGFEPSTRLLASGLVAAPPDIAESLQVEPGAELARLERLRLADDEPMSVEEAYLVHQLCPGVLAGDYTSIPLRQALEQNHGLRLVRAKQIIRAIAAPAKLAETLSIARTVPLLLIERVSYSQQNVPVEFLRITYRADRYSLYNELQG